MEEKVGDVGGVSARTLPLLRTTYNVLRCMIMNKLIY